jgi:hypothetical protein
MDERSGLSQYLPSWRRTADQARGDRLATAAIGLCTALLGAAVAMVARGSAAAVCVGLVTLGITPGCAVACWLTTKERLGRFNIVLAASMTWSVIVATSLAYMQITGVGIIVGLTAGVSGVICAVFLIAELSRGKNDVPAPAPQQERRGPAGWDDRRGDPRRDDRQGDQRRDHRQGDPRWDDRRGDPRWDNRQGPPGWDRGQGPAGREDREIPASPRGSGTGPRGGSAGPPASPRESRVPLVTGIIALVLVVGLLADTVHKADGQPIGLYGLLPVFGAPFYAAVVLTIVVAILALRYIRTAWPVAITALGLLAFELNGSMMLIVTNPVASWSYKHFGVTDYLVHGGALNDPLDVYQQWPGFFSVAAALVHMSGRTPYDYANWTGLFFVVLNAVTLFAITRRFARKRRIVPYVAVLLFLVVNWEGQEYFSPQTFAFELCLLFQLLLLPFLQPERLRRWFVRRRWLHISPVTLLDIPGSAKVGAAGTTVRVIGLIACLAAITVTHQLSPYMLFAGIVALWILGVLRHPVVLLGIVIIIVGYPLLHLTAVNQNSILNGISFSNATGTKGLEQATPPQEFAGELAKLVTVGLWGGTLVSGLSYWRRLGVVIIPLVLAFMPLTLVLGSSYGGEGIYRAFLFSSPWCSIVIATRVADLARAPVFRLVAMGTWAVVASFGSAQAGNFGQFGLLEMPTEEVTASTYFLDHAPVNSTLVMAASNFPSRGNGRYVLHNPEQLPNDAGLDTLPAYEGKGLESISAKNLSADVAGLARGTAFLVFAPTEIPLVEYFGTYAPGTLPTVQARLEKSPYWKVWYDKGGTVIIQAVPQGTPVVKKSAAKATQSKVSK